MTDQKLITEGNDTPEDVATLYSWANLHGAKYRDFSASRALQREEARLRVEEALAAEKRRQEEEAERKAQEEAQLAARLAAEAAEAARQAEAERLAEIARQAEAERQAVLAAQEAQRQAAQQRAWQPPPPEAYQGNLDSSFNPAGVPAGQSFQSAPSTFPPSYLDREVAPPVAHRESAATASQPQNYAQPQPQLPPQPAGQANQFYPAHGPAQGNPLPSNQNQSYAPAQSSYPLDYPAQPTYAGSSFAPQQYAPHHPDTYPPPSNWQQAEQRESFSQPAWLISEPEAPAQITRSPAPAAQHAAFNPAFGTPYNQGQAPSAMQPAYSQPAGAMYSQGPGMNSGTGSGQNPSHIPGQVDDTPLGSRERITNRWFALKNVFDPNAAPSEPVPVQPPARVPVLAVFSLAGGVGKTSLVASLGRALSSRGERVLLVDTAAFGLLPFFFGARDQRPGMLRTFNPPATSADAPIQLVTLDPDAPPPEISASEQTQDWITQEVVRYSRGCSRILIDLPTASGSTTRRILRLAPTVLVPVVPDMSSVVSVGAIESFFRHNATAASTGGKQIMPYYLLNQFDYSLPLHLDVREILREQIGDRLLPFALRRSPAVSEALAEGMTVMDYAPNATVAEDYANLAGWVRGLSAPATVSHRGVRWSER